MSPRSGAALAAMAASTGVALWMSWPWVLALGLAGFFLRTRGRRALAAFAGVTLAFNVLLFALISPGAGAVAVAGLEFGSAGAALGAVAALRLIALCAANLAVLDRVGPERLLDGMALGRTATAFAGAVALAASDVARDAHALATSARLDGRWPNGVRRVPAAAGLVAPLLVLAVRRSGVRRDALRLAGLDVPRAWVPLVAMTALAVAGRMAFVALPNIALTYVVVFAAGVLFGWRIGAAAGALCMAFTNLVLSGLQPAAWVNVPAMALLGVAGGLLRRLDWSATSPASAWFVRALAAAVGWTVTLSFSVVADSTTWLILPEARATPHAWAILVASGLVFNVVPALVNAAVFATVVPAAVRAWAATGLASQAPCGHRDSEAEQNAGQGDRHCG